MRPFFRAFPVLAAALLFISSSDIFARTVKTMTVEGGGTGPFKAEIVEDSSWEGYSIFRPADMAAAVSVQGPLPIVLFGNGGCSRSSWGMLEYLTELASHGYVLVTNGKWSEAAPARNEEYAQAEESGDTGSWFKKVERQNCEDALALLDVLDWLEKENARGKSEYFGMLDTDNCAAMGMSCGGLQALILGTCGDDRIKTTVPMNSGAAALPDGSAWMVEKEVLTRLQHPICYIIGDADDIAYPNASDDFKRISHVPVTIANLKVGHSGTYSEPHGGSFATVATMWLDFQLKGRSGYESFFRYCQVPEWLPGWRVNSKGWDEDIETGLYPSAADNGSEKVSYNDFGQVSGYAGVTSPTLTVSLPDPDKACGSAVLLFPGGGLMSLGWESDFRETADWLNSRGIAAIGVKYRLRTDFHFKPAPEGTTNKFLLAQGQITDFGDLVKANTNPSLTDPEDRSIENAALDALQAMRIVREHAAEWGIDPAKVGVLGFSAGGGVEISALLRADTATMPSFVGTVFGPALEDVTVGEGFPELFVAVHADHPNVAAGCLALFMEWKKAGVDAELHVYGEGTGGLYGGPRSTADRNTAAGSWREAFYSWLVAKGFVR